MIRFTKAWLWFYFILFALFGLIVFYPADKAHAGEPQDLPGGAVCEIKILANGLVETLFDIDGDGAADWMTRHRVTRDQKNQHHPLFIGYVPGWTAGQWNVIYIDREEDGWNGNEELYFQAE